MAQSIADTLVNTVAESSGQAPNIAGSVESGANLALHIQQVQQQKQQLEMQKQEQFVNKIMKVGSLYEAASKAEGKGQRFMYDKAIPNTVKALKLEEYFPESSQAMLQSNPAAVPYLVDQIRKDPAKFGPMTQALSDPTGEALAHMFPEIQQFGAIQAVSQNASDEMKQLSDASKFGMQQQNAEKRAEAFGNPRAEQVVTQKNEQAARAVKTINNDSELKMMSQQAKNIQKGMHLMEGNVSWKRLAEISQDFAGALSGKAASSDFKLKHIDTPTLKQKIADVTSFATSNPDQPADPAVVKYWMDMGKSLDSAYHTQIGARAKQLGSQAKTVYTGNPNAAKAVEQTVKSYANGQAVGGQARYNIGGQMMTADQVKAFTAAHPNLKKQIDSKILQEIESESDDGAE
jgi:hypothetical protein